MDDLIVDPSRQGNSTGILVRARHEGNWGTYDLSELDRDSFLLWISREQTLAVNTLLCLLNYQRIERKEYLKYVHEDNG